jgi:hypothetical protein
MTSGSGGIPVSTGAEGWERAPRTSPEQWAWPGSALDFGDVAAFCRTYAPDPDADRTVIAEIETIADLAGLLTDQIRKVWDLASDRPPGRQELTCAADVAEGLVTVTREAEQPGAVQLPPGALRWHAQQMSCLIDIPVIISPDSAPGTWRLVTHDHCEVRYRDEENMLGGWVSHAECSITAEGCLG